MERYCWLVKADYAFPLPDLGATLPRTLVYKGWAVRHELDIIIQHNSFSSNTITSNQVFHLPTQSTPTLQLPST